jgi:hypothetical protein
VSRELGEVRVAVDGALRDRIAEPSGKGESCRGPGGQVGGGVCADLADRHLVSSLAPVVRLVGDDAQVPGGQRRGELDGDGPPPLPRTVPTVVQVVPSVEASTWKSVAK